MPRYLSTLCFTDQGVQAVNDSMTRAEGFKETVEKVGGKVEAIYWAVGDADGVVIFDAPDEPTAASLLLKLAHDGFVRTKTLRVYDSTEFKAIVSAI